MSIPCKTVCDCRGCICITCPNVSKLNLKDESFICDHGTKPQCGCTTKSKYAKPCLTCDLDEPEPIADPERTKSIMKILTYDAGCICKVVTRALRADVHRYLDLAPRRNQPPED